MISIIVCHRNRKYLDAFRDNVAKNIGCVWELVTIDNTQNQFSIFEAYNKGVEQSKFELLCFAHEDIIVHSENWGNSVINHFEDISIGLIGIIGGTHFPVSPAPWWNNTLLNQHVIQNIQHWQKGIASNSYQTVIQETEKSCMTKQYNNPFNENCSDVAVVDGLWFCVRKSLFTNRLIRFDEDSFKGFHCYDSDISLQVGQFKRVCVVFDILVEHFQQGTINRNWFESVLILSRKWRKELPQPKSALFAKNYSRYEWECLQTFVYWMEAEGFSDMEISHVIKEYAKILPRSREGRSIAAVLIVRAKFGKFTGRIISKIFKIIK